jgi:hypothetical protein
MLKKVWSDNDEGAKRLGAEFNKEKATLKYVLIRAEYK